MSIIIKGMEMPKNCLRCPIFCGLPYQHRDEKGRRPDCPLIELPFAEELAEKLYKQIEKAVIKAEGSE